MAHRATDAFLSQLSGNWFNSRTDLERVRPFVDRLPDLLLDNDLVEDAMGENGRKVDLICLVTEVIVSCV